MSPGRDAGLSGGFSFPRVSGDEPTRAVGCELDDRFSPRERG